MSDQEILESEKALLASILYYHKDIEDIVDIDAIDIDLFVSRTAQRVFQSIRNSKPIEGQYDPILVLGALKKTCTNEKELESCVYYFNDLPKEIHYFSVAKYLQILKAHKVKRNLNKLASEITNAKLNTDNFEDALESWKNKFSDLTSQISLVQYSSAKRAIQEWNELVEDAKKPAHATYLKTRFMYIDRRVKSLGPGHFVVIASRPGVGKTTFALNLIHNNFPFINTKKLDNASAIGIFSLEMNTPSLINKLLAIDTDLDLSVVQKLTDGEAIRSWENNLIENSKKKIETMNLLFCDDANITIGKIISIVKSWMREHNLKLVIIDYLQLVNVNPDLRNTDYSQQYQKVGMISRNLKILAMELNICILALAQLNRKVEERRGGDRSPILSDLRESGSIEQDADVVMFLYEGTSEDKEQESSEPVDANLGTSTILKIAKNRHGAVGSVEFRFKKHSGVYEEHM